MISDHLHVGAEVAVRKGPVLPQTITAAVNGQGVDRLGFMSAVLALLVGATPSAPTTLSVVAKVQHSDDNATWSDYSPPSRGEPVVVAATPAVTAVNQTARRDVDLSGAKRYVRVTVTPTFTGGAAPSVTVAAALVLGGAYEKPVAD